MKKFYLTFVVLPILFLCSCSHKNSALDESSLALIRTIDRHGMSETVSEKQRLSRFQKVNFESPQPFKSVVRLYKQDEFGRQKSIITDYHDNGQLHQLLEAESARAHGLYQQWYPNGTLKVEGRLVEGIAELSESAKMTWVFDGLSKVYDDKGNIEAQFEYDKGSLENNALYFHPNGSIRMEIPYLKNQIHGQSKIYNDQFQLIGSVLYYKGNKHGNAYHFGNIDHPKFEEQYVHGSLMEGKYYDRENKLIYQIIDGNGFQPIYAEGILTQELEFQNGIQQGVINNYSSNGRMKSQYHVIDGQKHGAEWIYSKNGKDHPILYLNWYHDEIHGIMKTWYEDGSLQSQRELAHNLRQGVSTAWYRNGELMLVEEYENDQLVCGKYYKLGKAEAISSIEKGHGTATIFDENGVFLRRVKYKNSEIITK
ncbi:MAG: hypothetical protein P0S95_08365 [Rhabdochlamydiaceae bacterium]|nr:hypothetical protein [Candidatus Amphrikana amoebophyrae]